MITSEKLEEWMKDDYKFPLIFKLGFYRPDEKTIIIKNFILSAGEKIRRKFGYNVDFCTSKK